MNKHDAAKKKAEWLKYCLDIGWEKNDLDGLSVIWDNYYDEEGNRKPSLPSGEGPVSEAAKVEIERLRGILEKVVKEERFYAPQLPGVLAWQQFKTENNL